MTIYKRGGVYWYKFKFNGEVIRESTGQGSDRRARQIEAAHRVRLAKQQDGREEALERLKCTAVLLCEECEKWFNAEVAQHQDRHTLCSSACSAKWIKRHTPISTFAQFLQQDFKPYVETHFKAKPATALYYRYGVNLLLEAGMGALLLNEITSQHAVGYIAKQAKRSPSTVNCGLRTLRRALNLAENWKKIDRAPKLELAKGEVQRERVVAQPEFLAYRELCRQPWRDVATVLYGTAVRPGELYKLRWEHVLLNGTGGLIQIAEGKTRAARRFLPMVPEVYATLKERHANQKFPVEGWVFPAGSRSGHLEESSAKISHGDAMKKLTAASAAHRAWVEQGRNGDWLAAVERTSKLDREYLERHSGVIQAGWKRFQPYCLRHTALTLLAQAGCDAFTLARIAGHSSITITQRYIHPQADAIEQAFGKFAGAQLTQYKPIHAEGGHKRGHSLELAESNQMGLQAVTDCEIDG
ncbi:MAG: tyrosine-type recombinase/integrase [Silvibacterium sp.]